MRTEPGAGDTHTEWCDVHCWAPHDEEGYCIDCGPRACGTIEPPPEVIDWLDRAGDRHVGF